ncbi:hypothetical protein NLJ89_g9661 [Agrocybe chaxingu]|uniref:G domain-containing protein n=1 Tax=Agrocybe chaxingu TaxID=84603 RepID=A0A9W8JT16_9AGAR|nr:hypothetical protein NLJ89_g9661 [Agrocybe chaxingu]
MFQDGRDHADDDSQSADCAPPYDVPPAPRHVIIFGESGAGKSSVLNMVLGHSAATISNGGASCTFTSTGYDTWIDGTLFRIHDTAGLDEGEEGQVPKIEAIVQLYTLLQSLEEGISLLVFCIRAPRIKNAKNNWTMFYDIICQRQVPIAIVVTGLENEENMDRWWDQNRENFRLCGMVPHAHACVTATRGKVRSSGKYIFQEEYDESKAKVETMIKSCYREVPWLPEPVEWFGRIVYDTTYKTRLCRQPKEIKTAVVVAKAAIDELVERCGMQREQATVLGEKLEKLRK